MLGAGGVEDAAGREEVVRARSLVDGVAGRSSRAARSWDRGRPSRRRCGRTARRPSARRCGCRAPPQHSAGHADRHLRRAASGSRLGPASRALDGPRRLPEQRVERVPCLLQRRPAAGGMVARVLSSSVGRLGRVQLRGRAVLEARLGDPQRLLLDSGVLLGLPDQHLEGADRDVRARHLGGQRDQGGLVVGHRGEQARRPPTSTPRRYLPQKSSSQAASNPPGS